MKEKGRGKEIKIELSNNYNTLIGTVDNKNTSVVYLRISGWASPSINDDTINYNNVIKKIDKSVRSTVYKILEENKFHKDLSIVDLDIRKSGILFNKRSFMSCEVALFQKNNHKINSEFMIEELSKIINLLIADIFEENEYFKFHKKKK